MVRKRQDLDTTSAFERQMNDRTAEEVYTNLQLGFIRDDKDPNASEPDEVWEGYEHPQFDSKRAHDVAAHEAQRCKQIRERRVRGLAQLRESKAHRQLSAFDRIVRETQQWIECHSSSSRSSADELSTSNLALTRRASSHGGMSQRAADFEEDDDELSQMLECRDMLNTTPSYLKGKLRHYQIEGVNWLLNLFDTCVNGILADEMGLGKTFQTIATVSFLKFSHGLPGPHLVVVPKSVLGNWYREFRKWCPALNVYRFHGGSDIRSALVQAHLKPPIKHDVVLTTYEMVLYELPAFSRVQWQYLIVDEAHKLKNDEGRVHMALAKMRTFHRLLITGTPLQNDLNELRALLHFLSPELFDDAESFGKWFDVASGEQDDNAINRMHVILRPMMLRRLKKDVNTDIPPKKEIYVTCHMTKKQKDWYLSVMAKNAEAINRNTGGTTSLDNVLMHLRKVVNHPYLMPGAEEGPPFKTDDRLVTDAGKMIVLDKLLKRLRSDEEAKHKVLVFSQMTRMVDILEDYCIFRGWEYCRIDGGTSSYDRDKQMAQFNNPNSDKFIFLLSTRAGGLGINLQAANNVILYDSDWNPQMDLQAQDRAHRIGQTRTVRVYRFITDGTIEERIYKRALKKLYLDAVVVQQGRVVDMDKKASREEMLSMVKFGAEAVFKSRTQEVTNADIDRLITEGERQMGQLHDEARGAQQASLANFKLGVEEANIYDFEGVNYRQGVQSRMLHVTLPAPIAQEELHRKCAVFGDVVKTVIHPNLQEALVSFRTQSGASEAMQHLEFKCAYAAKDAQIVVSAEMVGECWNGGGEEELGRGKRKVRAPIDRVSEEQLDRIQKQTKLPPLKLPKKPHFKPFQLYNVARLEEIHNTEVSILVANWKRRYEATPRQVGVPVVNSTSNSPTTAAPAPAVAEVVEDEALSPEEVAEREALLDEGFSSWSHAEYRAFVAALCCGTIDRTDFAAIASAMGGTKSEGEVRDYAHAFFERGPALLPHFSKIEKAIAKGQQRVKREAEMRKAMQWKVESYERPHEQLQFIKPSKDLELDRAMFLMAYDNGMKTHGLQLDKKVKAIPALRFDVFYATRERAYFESRLRGLVASVKNEHERPLMEAGDQPPRTRKRGSVAAAATASSPTTNTAPPQESPAAPGGSGGNGGAPNAVVPASVEA